MTDAYHRSAGIVPTTGAPRKRGRGLIDQNPALFAAFQQISKFCTQHGYHAVAHSLSSGSIPKPTVLQTSAVRKALNDRPPWIHWNKSDMAPQLKCPDVSTRLTVATTVLRGYRMGRASHAATVGGSYFYEVLVQQGPTAKEIAAALPPQARLGPGLQHKLQTALDYEAKRKAKRQKRDQINRKKQATIDNDDDLDRKMPAVKDEETDDAGECPRVGGHVRLGWSMRTGDLQAPVGYDKWSYAIRDQGGSIIHKSQRIDDWGGNEGFIAGDIIGAAILLEPSNDGPMDHGSDYPNKNDNHIRFFKNGNCMGPFVSTKGKRIGGIAFQELEDGVYYPAVSLYLGGSVRANFGPYFISPPRKNKLPAGIQKQIKPLSNVCPAPITASAARYELDQLLGRLTDLKPDQVDAIQASVETEARMVYDAYQDFLRDQLEFVRRERERRGYSVLDLPVAGTMPKSDN